MSRWICTKACRAIGKNCNVGQIEEHPTNPLSTCFEAYSGDKILPINLNPTTDMDGTVYFDTVGWDDLRFPLTGQRLTVSAGRLDYDFEECNVEYGANARYPNEPICMVAQMPHAKKFGSIAAPHLHWVQSSASIPNWLLAYRFYNNGAVIPSWSLAAYTSHAFTYTSGSIMQITGFPHIPAPANENVSAVLDLRLFRDSANASTLFAGADPLAAVGVAKEFDLHIALDSLGSGREYDK